ncbi:MAG TPA: hypothetical protein VIR30_05590 [Nocardioides sp.]
MPASFFLAALGVFGWAFAVPLMNFMEYYEIPADDDTYVLTVEEDSLQLISQAEDGRLEGCEVLDATTGDVLEQRPVEPWMAQVNEDFAFSKARWTFEAGSGDLEVTCWGSGDVEIADAPERGEDIRILMLVFGVPAILVGLGVIAMCIWLIFFTQRRPEPNPRV